jgi:hypothetical protein
LSLSSQKYGFGIRDPRSGIRKKLIPDLGVKKAPDPGSATLLNGCKKVTLVYSCSLAGQPGGEAAGDRSSLGLRQKEHHRWPLGMLLPSFAKLLLRIPILTVKAVSGSLINFPDPVKGL